MLELILGALILALDQASKLLSARWLTTLPNNTYPLIEGVFHLTYIENRGASFGMLQGGRWFFIPLTVIVCAAAVYFLIKERGRMPKAMRVGLALIVAGAVGNLVDRVVLGYVRDMLNFALIDFAIFNVADSAVCVGMGILIIDVFFFKGKGYVDELEKRCKKRGGAPEDGA